MVMVLVRSWGRMIAAPINLVKYIVTFGKGGSAPAQGDFGGWRGGLDFHNLSLFDDLMRRLVFGCLLSSFIGLSGVAWAVTPTPALTDREIAERLTRLETRLDEGLTGLRSEMAHLRADMQEQNRQLRSEMAHLRTDMQEQNRQLPRGYELPL